MTTQLSRGTIQHIYIIIYFCIITQQNLTELLREVVIIRIIILQHYACWHCLWYVHLPTITFQPREELHANYTIYGLERAPCHSSLPIRSNYSQIHRQRSRSAGLVIGFPTRFAEHCTE